MDLADAHVHLFANGIAGRYGRACSGGADLEIYQSFRDEQQIDVALVIGYEGEPEHRGNNEYVALLAANNDWIAPVAFTPTDAPLVPPEPFAGISVYLSTEDDARRFAQWPPEIVQGLSSEQMIVSVNAVPATLAPAVEALRALDGCQILISHLGEPGAYDAPPSREQVSAALEPLLSLSDAAHVGVKLSALYALSNPAYAYPHVAARRSSNGSRKRSGSSGSIGVRTSRPRSTSFRSRRRLPPSRISHGRIPSEPRSWAGTCDGSSSALPRRPPCDRFRLL